MAGFVHSFDNRWLDVDSGCSELEEHVNGWMADETVPAGMAGVMGVARSLLIGLPTATAASQCDDGCCGNESAATETRTGHA